MIRITLVRHGETHNNRVRIVQGLDPTQGKLTDKGVRQAVLAGKALAEQPFQIAYCSPLERAVITLAEILAARGGDRTVPLVFPQELREVNLGTLQGRPHTEWKAMIAGDPMAWRPPQGESWLDLQVRVTDYLRRVIVPGGHQEILIVAHGGVNRSLIASLTGIAMGDTWKEAGVGVPQENSCVNVLELDDSGQLLSALVNDTRHLGEDAEASPGQRWLPAERRWHLLGAPGAGSHEFIPVG